MRNRNYLPVLKLPRWNIIFSERINKYYEQNQIFSDPKTVLEIKYRKSLNWNRVLSNNLMSIQPLRKLLPLLLALTIAMVNLYSPSEALAAAVWQKEDSVDYTLSELRKSDFSGQDVSGTSFAGADLQESNFEGVNLEGSILTQASFIDVNLQGANLREVFGDRVDFSNADLSDAILADSILTSSHFYNATVDGADFSGAMIDKFQAVELCKEAKGTNSTTGVDTRESLGC